MLHGVVVTKKEEWMDAFPNKITLVLLIDSECLIECSQSGDCGEANVMALHLASKSCRSHSQLKAFRSAIASLKLKRKANCIRAGSFSPLPLLPSSRNGLTASLLLIPLTPYKEVIFNREDSTRGYKGCTRPPQPRYGLAVLPMILLSRTNARPSERDLNNRFSCNLTERRLI